MEEKAIMYRVIRSRRRSTAIEITRHGEVLVRCPLNLSERNVRTLVQSRMPWIMHHLAKLPQKPPNALTTVQMEALREKTREAVRRALQMYAPLVGVDYCDVHIRCQKTRWGSCSAKGNLNFNCLLALAPIEVLEYVVVHELCHRKEMNHSPCFWSEVERVLPDYRVQRKWLRDHGRELMAQVGES